MLVTESTTEAFNILLPLLGAIVTDSGGLLSHSAIVAREYGIPGVVGTREATERIADGTRVRVDGDAGRGDGARVKRGRPTRRGGTTPRCSARRRSGSGRRCGTGSPCRRASRSRARSSRPSPPATRRRSRRSSRRSRPLGGPLAVRSSAVDEDGADASFAGQHLTLLNVPSAEELTAAAERDLVVGELRLGDHLPPARRALHPAERRRRRAGAARSRYRRSDVHAEPRHRRRRAGDRGELGARRGGRRRAA